MAVSHGRDTSGRTTITKTAEGALTEYTFVKGGTAATQVIICGAGEVAIGIVEASFADTLEATVYPQGQMLLKIGAGGVTDGGRVKSAASGVGVAASVGDAAYAVALEDGASGDVIRVQFNTDTGNTP